MADPLLRVISGPVFNDGEPEVSSDTVTQPRFVEGVVRSISPAGMIFTVPSWDGGKFLFGPHPYPPGASGTSGGGSSIYDGGFSSSIGGSVLDGGSSSSAGSSIADGGDSTDGSGGSVPVKGDRCLVLFPPGSGEADSAEVWVIGWWPA